MSICEAPEGKQLNCCSVCKVKEDCEALPEDASLKDLLNVVGDKKELMACQYFSWELPQYVEKYC